MIIPAPQAQGQTDGSSAAALENVGNVPRTEFGGRSTFAGDDQIGTGGVLDVQQIKKDSARDAVDAPMSMAAKPTP